jgi:curved DNA-binding protein
VVRLLPHPNFELEGDDLYTKVSIDFYTAALGGEARVQTLDRPVILKIPPKTQTDRTFRLRGKGMPKPNDRNNRGDLYARARVVLPENLSEQELNALRELAEAHRNRQSI